VIAVATEVLIPGVVIAFFGLLAILTFLRLLLRREPPGWLSIKIGFYVERVPREGEDNPRPLTTYYQPPREGDDAQRDA
jgi:hypothetical protein